MTSRLVVMKNMLAEWVQISGELGSGFALSLSFAGSCGGN